VKSWIRVSRAVGALLSLEVLLVAIVDQRVQSIDRLDDHVAAAAPVAAARPAELNVFLAAKSHAAVTAVARADIDFCLIEEFHRLYLLQGPACGNLGRMVNSARTQ
jgi:hypothetical protein